MDGASGVSAQPQHAGQRVELLAEERDGRRLCEGTGSPDRCFSGMFGVVLACHDSAHFGGLQARDESRYGFSLGSTSRCCGLQQPQRRMQGLLCNILLSALTTRVSCDCACTWQPRRTPRRLREPACSRTTPAALHPSPQNGTDSKHNWVHTSRAASAPRAPIAMPTSAAASAGASFTPSPTTTTGPLHSLLYCAT